MACPYCMIMLDDGLKARGREINVLDVAQVVARATGAEEAPGPELQPTAGRAPRA